MTGRPGITGLLTLCLLFAAVTTITGQGKPAPSYQIKAGFLYNFTRFVEWPEDAFKSSDAPFVIGVIGNTQLAGFLAQIVNSEKIGDHPVIVENFSDVRSVSDCHILFISSGELPDIKGALSGLHQRNVLTVSESAGFLRMGGIVRFYTERNKIKIEINVASAKRTQLQISSKLLSIATIYNR